MNRPSMRVRDLIEELRAFDPGQPVYVSGSDLHESDSVTAMRVDRWLDSAVVICNSNRIKAKGYAS